LKINTPLLIGFLVISLLLNAAGIVFFILFLSEHGHNKSVRREKAALERNLAVVRSGNIINQVSASDSVQKRLFVSQFDGQMDTYAFQAPQASAPSLDYILVVYLHGMGSNQMEPFVTPTEQPLAAYISRDNPKVGVLSCNYRKEASWGNDAAISDVIQNTREILQEYPFKTIVLMGTSMGGCVALNFAATAPEDIKSKIAGVVSMESAGDLKALWNETEHREIRPAMMIAFGGTPDQFPDIYSKKSLLSNIDSLPKNARVYMLSAREDKIVPPDLQKTTISELNQKGFQTHLDEIDGKHQAPPAQYYSKGLKFVLGDNNI
jgi:pimeloyl-ACP methyl ester carboxylesterase